MKERVNNVLEIVREMDDDEKQELIRHFMDECLLSEEEEDALVIASRRKDSTKPYSDFLEELKKEGRPV